MPLTRRVQVFIGPEASAALDGLLDALDMPNSKSLIEHLLLSKWHSLSNGDSGIVSTLRAGAKEANERYAAHDEALKFKTRR